MAKKQPKYLVIEKLSKELPTELDAAEREALKDRENQLGEAVLVLEREHESIRAGEKEEARTRREAIKDARAAWSKTIDERRSGTAMREYKCELRAVIASQTIDLVRVTDDIAPALPLTTTDAALTDEPDATEGDTLPDDECDAIRVPHGWPRAWLDRIWRVDDAALPLSGGDVAQVYHPRRRQLSRTASARRAASSTQRRGGRCRRRASSSARTSRRRRSAAPPSPKRERRSRFSTRRSRRSGSRTRAVSYRTSCESRRPRRPRSADSSEWPARPSRSIRND